MKPRMNYVVASSKSGRRLTAAKGSVVVGNYDPQNSEEIKAHNAKIDEERRLKRPQKRATLNNPPTTGGIMARFKVYKQEEPISGVKRVGMLSVPFKANLVFIQIVIADSGKDAINKAKRLPAFKFAGKDTLGAFPIVEPVYEKRTLH